MTSGHRINHFGYSNDDAIFANLPSLPVSEAEAIRDIALEEILPIAAKVKVVPETGTRRCTIWLYSSQTSKDGIANSVLTLSIRNNASLGNRALVSVRELTAFDTGEIKVNRDIYSFEWREGESLVLAKKQVLVEIATIAIEGCDDLTEEVLKVDRVEGVQLVNEHDCDELAGRMLTIAYASRS